MDLPTTVATIAFLSAANQRFIEVTDWLWCDVADWWLRIRPRKQPDFNPTPGGAPGTPPDDMGGDAGGGSQGPPPATDPDRNAVKGHVINLVATAVGFGISRLLVSDQSITMLIPMVGPIAPGESMDGFHRFVVDLVVGMMISGGTESTNSVVKWLQASKEAKANVARSGGQ